MTANIRAHHEQLGLGHDEMLEIYYFMLLTRRVDERLWLLQRGGKIPFVISPQGAEAAQVGAAYAFRRRHDYYCPYYRDLGINLVAGVTVRDVMLGAFARADCPASGGKQMPSHWGNRPLNVLNGSSPVTTQLLHAVGIAQAARMKGKDVVVYTCCGEGSSNQGDFHEALNWAGVHNLPVIFMVQNNQYAISVPLDKQVAGGSVAARGRGYGMPGVEVDGTNVLKVYAAFKEAHDRALRGEGPSLIEAHCIRITSHSSDDDQRRYREPEDIEAMKSKDPINKITAYLLEHGVATEADLKAIDTKIITEINAATDWAEAQPPAQPEFALTHVYGEGY